MTDLYVQRLAPEGAAQATVWIVHGIGEHSGRHRALAELLVARGYAACALDLRGHGRSPGRRGHALVSEAVADLDGLLEASAGPTFLYGHSFGAVVVLAYVLRRGPAVAGVVASAAPLRNALQRQRAKLALVRTGGALAPRLTLASGLTPEALSRDAAVVEAYRADPLVHDRVSLGWARELLRAIDEIAAATRFPVPLLLVHGSDDAISDVAGASELAARWGGDCTLRVYEGLYHECHNEAEGGRVLADVVDWLDERRRALA